jgi:hypothetical protein
MEREAFTNAFTNNGEIGVDLVSESMITFPRFGKVRTLEKMKRDHAIIYDSCPVGTVCFAHWCSERSGC